MSGEELGRLPPEGRACIRIDAMLEATGRAVQDHRAVNLYAGKGVAVREFAPDAGRADYVLSLNRQSVGVLEAKETGTTLFGAPRGDRCRDRGGPAGRLEEFEELAESLQGTGEEPGRPAGGVEGIRS